MSTAAQRTLSAVRYCKFPHSPGVGDGPGTIWEPAGRLGSGYLIPHFCKNFTFCPLHCPINLNIYEDMSKKLIFSPIFLDLDGSLVAQMVSKQVGNGLETYLLTFGTQKYQLWTILGSFLVHFGPILAPFWAIFLGPKCTKKVGLGPKKGSQRVQNGTKMAQN